MRRRMDGGMVANVAKRCAIARSKEGNDSVKKDEKRLSKERQKMNENDSTEAWGLELDLIFRQSSRLYTVRSGRGEW